jgi:hypothetical protein
MKGKNILFQIKYIILTIPLGIIARCRNDKRQTDVAFRQGFLQQVRWRLHS